jgi:hypothetical protein
MEFGITLFEKNGVVYGEMEKEERSEVFNWQLDSRMDGLVYSKDIAMNDSL